MKVNRKIAVFSAAVMSMAFLAGCGNGEVKEGAKETQGEGQKVSQTETSDAVTIKFVHKFPEEKRMQYFNEIIA